MTNKAIKRRARKECKRVEEEVRKEIEKEENGEGEN